MTTAKPLARYGATWGRARERLRSAELHHQPGHDRRCGFGGVGCRDANGRVEVWRGGFRSNISVTAPFVWRCLSGSTMAPFPHPAHRTGHAGFPHPALGQDFTPSPTTKSLSIGGCGGFPVSEVLRTRIARREPFRL